MSSPSMCCCPINKVDWDKPGGIYCCNFPCGCDIKLSQPIYGWFVDESKDQDIIYIPDKTTLMPAWILAMPCFWIHFCIMTPMFEANVFKMYEKDGNLTLEYKSKNSCSEEIKYTRRQLILASFDDEPATLFKSRKVRLSLLCSNGMVPDKSVWVSVYDHDGMDVAVIIHLVELINSKIERLKSIKSCQHALITSTPSAPDEYCMDSEIPIATAVVVSTSSPKNSFTKKLVIER